MADEMKLATVQRRLAEARTIGYLLAFFCILVAIGLDIEYREFLARRSELEKRRTAYEKLATGMNGILSQLRRYILERELVGETDRTIISSILQASQDASSHAEDIVRTKEEKAQKGWKREDVEKFFGIWVLPAEDDPEEPRTPEVVFPADELEELRMPDLLAFARHVSKDPIQSVRFFRSCEAEKITSSAVMLYEGFRCSLDVPEYAAYLEELAAQAESLVTTHTSFRKEHGKFSRGGLHASLRMVQQELRAVEMQRRRQDEVRRKAQFVIPVIAHRISSSVVARTFPVVVLVGCLLLAVPLVYVRDSIDRLGVERARSAVDSGIAFTELRRRDGFSRFVAWPLVILVLGAPALCGMYVLFLSKGQYVQDAWSIGLLSLSVVVTLGSGFSAWSISEVVEPSPGNTTGASDRQGEV